jgi:hypothetical protein
MKTVTIDLASSRSNTFVAVSVAKGPPQPVRIIQSRYFMLPFISSSFIFIFSC